MHRLRTQIDNLSFKYIKSLNDDNTFLLFCEAELAGLPSEFLKVQHVYVLLVCYCYLTNRIDMETLLD